MFHTPFWGKKKAALESSPCLGTIQLREESHEPPLWPQRLLHQMQGLILPCLGFPPCPRLLRIVTHPEDGQPGEGFLPLLRKALGLGVLIQAISPPPRAASSCTLCHCCGRGGMKGDHQLEKGGAAPGDRPAQGCCLGLKRALGVCCEHQDLPGKGQMWWYLGFLQRWVLWGGSQGVPMGQLGLVSRLALSHQPQAQCPNTVSKCWLSIQ